MDQVSTYFEKQIAKSNEYLQEWCAMKDFYDKKLWHQLTCLILKNIQSDDFCLKSDFDMLNDVLFNDIKSRISAHSYAVIAVRVADIFYTKDQNKAIEFLKNARDNSMKTCLDGKILCNSQLGEILLKSSSDLQPVREIIESTHAELETIETISEIHSKFYQLSCKYYEKIDDNATYYKEALKFLGCTNFEKMPLGERQNWAYSIGIAALIGEKVLNYGELMSHGILDSLLDNAEKVWLRSLIEAFSKGDLEKIKSMRPQWIKNDRLKNNEKMLIEKAYLLCLVELLFNKPANSRSVSFAEIARATCLDIKEVDGLLMRALSLHLIEGKIDDINQSIILTWLQPRVLDATQIQTMKSRLDTWLQTVGKMKSLVEVDVNGVMA